ncbi:MAG: hypothetical protein NZM12_11660 [Steroidobacteraceae bacterium]|nr:hypothetical protein [Steroidobacteraceae bacterium]MDW8258072.1 hypothetical protein [Gammaproteobacteria bacterium]
MWWRWLYVAWLIGAIVVFARGLSSVLFGGAGPALPRLARAVFLALLWPIAVLTREGRSALRSLAHRGS